MQERELRAMRADPSVAATDLETSTPPVRRDALRDRLVLRASGRHFVIVPFDTIVRIEASDNCVVVIADHPYRHRETLSGLCARLPAHRFVRVHRSHAINPAAVETVRRRQHGEFALSLRDGSTIVTGRRFSALVETAFGHAPPPGGFAKLQFAYSGPSIDDSRCAVSTPNSVG